MSTHRVRPLRRSLVSAALIATAGSILLIGPSPQPAVSQMLLPPNPVVRVEEDWVIVLNEPNGNVTAPQFHTVMAPFPDFATTYAQVLWNYRENPRFLAGGVQLQSYWGEDLNRARSMEFSMLNTSAETISWTQVLVADGSVLSFEVVNGNSVTWGMFGKDMRLATDSTLNSLNDYSADFSAQNSGVTYGSNRVDLMVITEVRRYDAAGLVTVDATPRVVFQLN